MHQITVVHHKDARNSVIRIADRITELAPSQAVSYTHLTLPLVHCVERKRIAPTKVIPVSDVLAEHDCLHAGNELGCIKAGEERVGWGAIRAAFRGEELDQNRLAHGLGG